MTDPLIALACFASTILLAHCDERSISESAFKTCTLPFLTYFLTLKAFEAPLDISKSCPLPATTDELISEIFNSSRLEPSRSKDPAANSSYSLACLYSSSFAFGSLGFVMHMFTSESLIPSISWFTTFRRFSLAKLALSIESKFWVPIFNLRSLRDGLFAPKFNAFASTYASSCIIILRPPPLE